MIDVNTHLQDAIKRYTEAKGEIVHDSIYLLCTLIREEFPEAQTVEFEWSDQGSWLTLSFYDNGEDFGDFDDDNLTSNLDDTTEGIWSRYMQPGENRGNRWTMNIDSALAKSTVAINQPTLTDPDEIEEFLKS